MNRDILLDNLDLLSIEVSTIQQLRNLIIDLAVTGKFSQGMFPLELGSEVVSNSLEKSKSNTTENLIDCIAYCEVPSNWSWANTEILCHTQTGATPDKSAVIDKDSIAYITSADIQSFRAHSENRVSRSLEGKKLRIAPSGSILFVGIGNVGRCGVTEIESTFNQQIHSATPYIVNPKFLCFFYSSTFFRNQIDHLSSATTLTILNKSKWSSIPVPVPPIVEQKWIVDKIEELLGICDGLEAKLNIRNLVGAAARESAVDAISTAQSPRELQLAWERIQSNWEVIAGSRESIQSLRELILDILIKPKKVDEWQIKSFADLLTISNGDRSKNYPSKEHRVSAGIPFVNAGHLKDGLIDLTDMDYISRKKFQSLSGGKFQNGDILFCLRGSLGKSALVKDIGEGTVASSLAIFKVGVEIDTEYLFWFLQSGMARIQIKKFDNGTAQPNLAAKSVLKFQIPLPKLPEQKSIVLQVGELMKSCEHLEQKIIQKENIIHKFARSVVSASA
jgi:type I restriction enzyme S subunit